MEYLASQIERQLQWLKYQIILWDVIREEAVQLIHTKKKSNDKFRWIVRAR